MLGAPLPSRTLSQAIVGPDGDPAIKIETLPIVAGQQVVLAFEAVGPRWRQGVFLATAGVLATSSTRSASLVIWSDTAPVETSIAVIETGGDLLLYNIWDSGRRRRPFESQSHTSGMIVEELPDGWLRYSCTDMGTPPDFGSLVFRLFIR